MKRCSWVNLNNQLYVKYHDDEWGIPKFDDNVLFEFLVLEMFQAGLSWEIILNKRESFRKSFDDFQIDKIISYDEDKVLKLMQDKSIIRNKRKIQAMIKNASVFKSIQEEFGSFANYIWSYTNGEIVKSNVVRSTSPLSDEISCDLQKRGMSFVGSTIIYSYLQAIGIINDHEIECFKCCKV